MSRVFEKIVVDASQIRVTEVPGGLGERNPLAIQIPEGEFSGKLYLENGTPLAIGGKLLKDEAQALIGIYRDIANRLYSEIEPGNARAGEQSRPGGKDGE